MRADSGREGVGQVHEFSGAGVFWICQRPGARLAVVIVLRVSESEEDGDQSEDEVHRGIEELSESEDTQVMKSDVGLIV